MCCSSARLISGPPLSPSTDAIADVTCIARNVRPFRQADGSELITDVSMPIEQGFQLKSKYDLSCQLRSGDRSIHATPTAGDEGNQRENNPLGQFGS